MDMNFNFSVDHAEEVRAPRSFRAEQPVSQWIVAEIQADLCEELARRGIAQNDQ